ncbi:MFS transporter [Brachybacterium sp. EF45031]|uniref:MFS transporter n=1 Tax=Brachybacterium sillae TaxID=2810536 RepID=UPI00217D709D|nr:MFS transporter [Brachybacterium sillae]MCS6710732.1 MFS transporter [Brachybacterium sillae]
MHRWMSIQFFLFFFTWTTFLAYWGVIFDERGFAASEIGLSITVSLVTRAVAIAVLFPMLNRVWPLGRVVRVLPWASLAVALLFLPSTGVTGLVVLSGIFGLLYPTLMPVLETTAALGVQRQVLDYGRARGWGSIGFVAGAAVNGVVAQLVGNAPLWWVFLLGLLALAVTASRPLGEEHVEAQRSDGFGGWAPLLRSPVFVPALAITVVLQSSHAAYYAFGSLHLVRLGAAAWVVATFLVIAPLAEMLLFRVTGPIAQRASLAAMLGISTAGALLRWGVWALDPGVAVLLGTQVLHALTFGLMQVTFIQTLNRHVPAALVAPAQGLYMALGTGAGTAVMTAVAGALFDLSPALTFAAMALSVLLAVPLLLLLRRRELGRHREPDAAVTP